MKRCLAMLLTLSMLMYVMIMPVGAAATILDTDFNDASYTVISNSADGDLFNLTETAPTADNGYVAIATEQCTYNGEGTLVTSTGTTKDTNVQHYEDAVYGKQSGDKSLALRIDGGAGTSAAMQWFLRFHEGSSSTTLNDGRVYEFSVAKTGGVGISFYALNSIGSVEIPLEEGKWNRVAFYFPTVSSGGKVIVYVNGEEKINKTVTGTIYRTRLRVDIPKGTTKAFVGIDDMRMLSSQTTYDGTATALPTLSVTGDTYLLKDNFVKIPSDSVTTADALTAALSTSSTASVRIYDDAMTAAVKGPEVNYSTYKTGSDTVEIGDVIVLQDGSKINYYNVDSLSPEDKYIVNYDFEEEEEKLSGTRTNYSKTKGLYTRSADDTSFIMTSNADTEASAFVNLPAYPSYKSNFDASGTYTAEFSIAAMDDEYKNIQVYLLSKPTNAGGASTTATIEAVNIAADGNVTVYGQSSSFVSYSVNKNEWIRVAITLNNSTQKFDTYINGVLAASDVSVNSRATYPNWAGLDRLSVMAFEKTAGNGTYTSVAIDDLKIYKGAYEGMGDAVSMGDYTTEGSTLYLKKNSVRAEDIAAALGYTVAAYTDNTYNTVKTEYLGDGDIVVVTNGLVKRYFTVSTKVLPVIDKNFDDKSQTVKYSSDRCTTPTYEEAKFGKPAGDYSYAMTTNTENSSYYNLHADTHLAVGNDWTSDSYTAGSGVIEFSLAFDGNAKKFELLNWWAYKNTSAATHSGTYDERTYSVPLQITGRGKVTVHGAKDDFEIYRINPGEWLHVAMVIDGINESYDLYLNGVLAADDVSLAYSGKSEGTWQYIGINGMRDSVYPVSATQAATLYLDDFRVYAETPENLIDDAVDLGEYENIDSVLLSSTSPDADTISELLNGYTVTAYEDNTYSTVKTGALEAGDVVVVNKGSVYRYLTVSDTALGLSFMINGTKANNLAAGELSASITPKGYAIPPILIMAVYNNYGGSNMVLVDTAIAKDTDADGIYTTKVINITADELKNSTVKLMIWDNFEAINPLIEAVTYSAN